MACNDEYLKCCQSTNPDALRMWGEACRSIKAEEIAWVEKLKINNIVAAHPDDGWVNRKENFVDLCYPYYNSGIEVGSLIALGYYCKFRIVKITSIGISGPLTETPLYYFTGTSITI